MSIPTTRKEALSIGSKTFFTGKPCKNGHTSERYTSCGICIECLYPNRKNSLESFALAELNKALRQAELAPYVEAEENRRNELRASQEQARQERIEQQRAREELRSIKRRLVPFRPAYAKNMNHFQLMTLTEEILKRSRHYFETNELEISDIWNGKLAWKCPFNIHKALLDFGYQLMKPSTTPVNMEVELRRIHGDTVYEQSQQIPVAIPAECYESKEGDPDYKLPK